VKLLKRFFGSFSNNRSIADPTGRITLGNPLVIKTPRIGFLNLMGSSAETILNQDKAVLSPIFSSTVLREDKPPLCDVLLIYGHLESNGRFTNYSDGLRDIIKESTAPIVIVASENTGDSYIAAGKHTVTCPNNMYQRLC